MSFFFFFLCRTHIVHEENEKFSSALVRCYSQASLESNSQLVGAFKPRSLSLNLQLAIWAMAQQNTHFKPCVPGQCPKSTLHAQPHPNTSVWRGKSCLCPPGTAQIHAQTSQTPFLQVVTDLGASFKTSKPCCGYSRFSLL